LPNFAAKGDSSDTVGIKDEPSRDLESFRQIGTEKRPNDFLAICTKLPRVSYQPFGVREGLPSCDQRLMSVDFRGRNLS